MRGERYTKLLDLLQCNVRPAKERKAVHRAGQRTHQIKRGDHIAGERPRVQRNDSRQQKQNQSDQREIEQMRPALRANKTHLGGDVVPLKHFRGLLNVARSRMRRRRFRCNFNSLIPSVSARK